MNRAITHCTLVVEDYDDAIHFYVSKLKFHLLEDTKLDEHKRWVLVGPSKMNSFSLLLAKADSKNQKQYIGNQSGGRVFLFLKTDNFDKDYQNLLDQNINIIREPKEEAYGKVLVFEDLYGNLWDLIEPVKK